MKQFRRLQFSLQPIFLPEFLGSLNLRFKRVFVVYNTLYHLSGKSA